MEHLQIADEIEQMVKVEVRRATLRSAIVTAVTGGLTKVRRAGSSNAEGGYARLIPGVPKAGQRVAMAKMGGAELVLGVISRVAETLLDLGAPIVGQTYPKSLSQGSATNSSTTSVAPTYADAITLSWSDLPDGTYDIDVVFAYLAAHASGGSVSLRSTCGASNGSAHALNADSGTTGTLRIEACTTYTSVVVAGGITIKGQYAVASSGTAYARNPTLKCVATRKA